MPKTTIATSPKSSNLPDWFPARKERLVFEYDTNRYPFKQLIADWLGVPSCSLENIHTLPLPTSSNTKPIHPRICKAWKAAEMPRLSSEAREYSTLTQQKLFQSPEYERLMNTYRLFIKEVVAPLCTDTSHDTNNIHVVYQSPPTTRVVLPNGRPTISMHCDKEYKNHQEAEINFWVPLTNVWGTNSLWLESQPNLGDFEPVSLRYGQAMRFDGHDCRHYTVQNETDSCRVSIDFRVVPSELCTQRQCCGDFCVEETTNAGFISYPHKFWKITRGINIELDKRKGIEASPLELTLNSCHDSSVSI